MRITLIGSGNVATHLGAAFKNAGHRIVQVYSPNTHNASLLAYHIGAEAISDLQQINPDTDIFVISVKDDVIAEMVQALLPHQKLTVHTSGATGIAAITAFTDDAGVFYPLQTFSKTREVDFLNVPLCIEGANDEITRTLTQLTQSISNKVYQVSSEQRKVLHLSAVFACNFPNFLYGIAQQLLADSQMPFDMIRPLILETAQKVQTNMPAAVQTGPAVRNDRQTMEAHLQMLHGNPELENLYRIISQEIIKNKM